MKKEQLIRVRHGGEIVTLFSMTYNQREKLKHISCNCSDADARALLLIIAHWMRQCESVDFEDYASNWIVADNGRFASEYLKEQYPLVSERKIENGYSDWNSYGKLGYKL